KENNLLQNVVADKPQFFGTIIEIEVSDQINFHWSHENLDNGRKYGAKAADDAVTLYEWCKNNNTKQAKKLKVLMIPDDLDDNEIRKAGVLLSRRRIRQAIEAGRPVTADERERLKRP